MHLPLQLKEIQELLDDEDGLLQQVYYLLTRVPHKGTANNTEHGLATVLQVCTI